MDPITQNSKFQFLDGQAYYYSGKTDLGKNLWRTFLQQDPDMKLCQDAIRNTKKQDDMKEESNT